MQTSVFQENFNSDISPNQFSNAETISQDSNQTQNDIPRENDKISTEDIVSFSNFTTEDNTSKVISVDLTISFTLKEANSKKLLLCGISYNETISTRIHNNVLEGVERDLNYSNVGYLKSDSFYNLTMRNLGEMDSVHIYYRMANLEMNNISKLSTKSLFIKVKCLFVIFLY